MLFTSLSAYKWQRRLVYGKLVSTKVDPTTGILAGAMAAPYEMLLFTIDCLIEIKELPPFPIQLTLHVDDLNLTVSASTLQEAFDRLEQATKVVCQVFEKHRLQVEKKKFSFVTSCDELDEKVK